MIESEPPTATGPAGTPVRIWDADIRQEGVIIHLVGGGHVVTPFGQQGRCVASARVEGNILHLEFPDGAKAIVRLVGRTH